MEKLKKITTKKNKNKNIVLSNQKKLNFLFPE